MRQSNTNLYTIILDYKKHTYVYQLFAENEYEAQYQWALKIDLNIIGVLNPEKIKAKLIFDAKEEDENPGLLNGLQSAWCASICACNLTEPYCSAGANIIATKIYNEKIHNNFAGQKLFKLIQNKLLYTIQLDYKGGSYAYQVFEKNPLSAKIKWLKEFDFNVVYGTPKNIEVIKNHILLHKNDPDFIPQKLKEFDSVWSTTVQLGDEAGRVTIVATQTDFLN